MSIGSSVKVRAVEFLPILMRGPRNLGDGALTSSVRNGGTVSLLLWAAPASLFVVLAMVPAQLHTQVLASSVLLAVLAFTYRVGRRARTLRGRQYARLVVIFLSLFLALRYMHWRATESLPLQFGLVAMVCGLLLFLAEGYGFVNMLLGFFINSEPFERESIPLPEDESRLPHVDVYIPTYNEDPIILRPTVIAATQMDYPADRLHVYILDDGGTTQKCNDRDPAKAAAARARAAELKAIAERYGAGYLTREKNEHAKAGNLNNALQHTRGELLLILDCDHIPTADLLQRTVGFFLADPKLFVLQTPHNFVSPDPVERNLDTYRTSPAENELFYDVMQPGLDFWGTSFFCGSAAILRRSVVDELGGVSGQTITEDAETTLDALSLGYRSAYYRRPMVSGLQPETYTGFIVQRVRWGQGMLQIFTLKNPWLQPRLRLTQRVLYTNFAFYWGFAPARIIMLMAPPAYLIFGINLCDTTAVELLAYSVPSLVASMISTQFFYGRVRWPFISQLYETVQSFYVLRGMIEVLRRPRSPSFKVTPKGELLDEDFISSLARPFYVFLAVTLLGIGLGAYRLSVRPWSAGAIAFVMSWALLDVLLLLGALGITYERRQRRAEPRCLQDEPVCLRIDGHRIDARSTDASASGLGVCLPTVAERLLPVRIGAPIVVEWPERAARLAGIVQSVAPIAGGRLRLGIEYRLEAAADERIAVHAAFGSSEALVRNNALRHQGLSVLGGLIALAHFAFSDGVGHLLFLARRQVARVLAPFRASRVLTSPP